MVSVPMGRNLRWILLIACAGAFGRAVIDGPSGADRWWAAITAAVAFATIVVAFLWGRATATSPTERS